MTEVAAFARSTPEAQGISSEAVHAFLDAAERIPDVHSLILVRRGAVVAEGYWDPFVADEPHMQFSLSKSVTASATGLLVAEREVREAGRGDQTQCASIGSA